MSKLIYLASQSPRRAQLLELLGVKYALLVPSADEDAEGLEVALKNEAPSAYVQRVTGLKLDAALLRHKRRGLPAGPVLCSDTTVALGRVIYGKPESEADAVRMLTALSGQTHRVLTAIALQSGTKRVQALSVSKVTFASMTPKQIQAYVASGEPMGKAGAYAIQGRAAAYVSHISGSLPMHETATLLAQLKLL
jgi:septum formation protein